MNYARPFNLKYWKQGNITFLTPSNLLQEHSILVAFTSRRGGVSRAPYDCLNLAFQTGDKSTNIVENRRRLCQALNLNLISLTTAQQIHSNSVAIVTEDEAGCGAFDYQTALSKTDALITNLPGVPLALFYADCLPIAIVDSKKRAVGIIHAGWKGSLEGIAVEAILSLKRTYESQESDLLVFMGPSIGRCCYEIGNRITQEFQDKFPSSLSQIDGRWHLDLKRINYEQLICSGIPAENIYWTIACTSCQDALFFSHRRAKEKTGRQAGLVALIPPS